MREIEVLDGVSYVIEAIAEDLPSEARTELGALLSGLGQPSDMPADVHKTVTEGLRDALDVFQDRDPTPRRSAVRLAKVSRFLWKRLQERSKTSAPTP